MLFTFYKLYKWYQIAQNIIIYNQNECYFSGIYLQSFINILYTFPQIKIFCWKIQLNLSLEDTIRTKKSVCYKEVTVVRGWDFSRLRNGKKWSSASCVWIGADHPNAAVPVMVPSLEFHLCLYHILQIWTHLQHLLPFWLVINIK